MTMHVLGRPRRRPCAPPRRSPPSARWPRFWLGMTALALPAGAKTRQPTPTYTVRTILSGKSLHHCVHQGWIAQGAAPPSR